MKVLVTAFEPFGGAKDNQSKRLLEAINFEHVSKLLLPVTFKQSFDVLKAHLSIHHYDMIIALGEAPYSSIAFEHVAINVMHARIPDNVSFQPLNLAISNGEMTFPTLLPIDTFKALLAKHQLKYLDSYHAGTYVCNDLFYRLMSHDMTIPRGFIHVPNDPKYFKETLTALQIILKYLK
jgi:pyroglutamyl-peptidase